MACCLMQNRIFKIRKFCSNCLFKHHPIYWRNDEKREEGLEMMGGRLAPKCFSGEIVDGGNCCCAHQPYNLRLLDFGQQ